MSQDACRIVPIASDLPQGFDALLGEALQEGHEFIVRFHARWQESKELYEGENEGVFAAFMDERLVGIAGMGVDPYAKDPAIGRLRHVFVTKAARRKGVAEALVRTCLQRGKNFNVIRLRSRNPEASRLYERLGFLPVTLKDATHILRP